jgi:hypothetical protein
MVEGLSLWLPGPCCPARDIDGEVVALSSTSHNIGARAERWLGPLWAPKRLHEGGPPPCSPQRPVTEGFQLAHP